MTHTHVCVCVCVCACVHVSVHRSKLLFQHQGAVCLRTPCKSVNSVVYKYTHIYVQVPMCACVCVHILRYGNTLIFITKLTNKFKSHHSGIKHTIYILIFMCFPT